MPHYIAFLRGINLGRRRIKMNDLSACFEAMKLAEVETFIASGNVIFTSKSNDARKLEQQIQAHLNESLGYEVDTFVRTRAEVAAIAAFRPFATTDLEHPDHTVHVGFMRESLTSDQLRKFRACSSAVNAFQAKGREYFWLRRLKSDEFDAWASPQMKAVKLPSSSMRNLTTIRKLASLYPAPTT